MGPENPQPSTTMTPTIPARVPQSNLWTLALLRRRQNGISKLLLVSENRQYKSKRVKNNFFSLFFFEKCFMWFSLDE